MSILLIIIGIVAGLFSYISMTEIIVDLTNSVRDMSLYTPLCINILITFVIKGVAAGISASISHIATFNSLGEIKNDISEKLFKMPLGDVLSGTSGELKNIMVEQVDSMETLFAHLMPEFTASLVGPILLLIYMFTLDWRLILLSLIPFVVGIFIMMSAMGAHYEEMFGKLAATDQHMDNSIVEYVNGIEVTKTFNQNESPYKKYADVVYDSTSFYCNWMGKSMNRAAIGRLLSPMGVITIVPFGILFYINGSIDLGGLITLIVLSFATASSILRIMNYMDDISRISIITSKTGKILDSRELGNIDKGEKMESHSIELQDVDFSYDGKNKIIDNLSTEIKESSVSALVGPSGPSKSTITKLIAGSWNIDKGSIKIDEAETRDVLLGNLSPLIFFVSRDNFLFDMTIRESIRLGNENASDEEIIDVCEKSVRHDFIVNLSNGYDTGVGEGGGHLSGEERQRISIVRVILKNVPIAVLDEVTSYIDPENEALIQNALANPVKGKTLIIIAHRLKAIVDADRILATKDGKLNSHDTHEGLLESSEPYKEVCAADLRDDENV